MTDHRSKADETAPNIGDEPLVLYAGDDAILLRPDGSTVDLNALEDPFTGTLPQPVAPPRLRSTDDDLAEAAARERLGHRLRALRQNARLSLADLAERVGVPASRIAAVERGQRSTGLFLVSGITAAVGARLADVVASRPPQRSNDDIRKLAVSMGVPSELLKRIEAEVEPDRYLDTLARGFHWDPDDIRYGAPRSEPLALAPVFKSVSGTPPRDSPTLVLAWALSVAVAEAYQMPYRPPPPNPQQLRAAILSTYQGLTLNDLLQSAWQAGIVILPLRARRDFVAAVWMVHGTPVIVLNDARTISAYWTFDIAHEIGHLALGHATRGIVEVGRPEQPDPNDDQEREANGYALRLLLPDPEAILSEVRRRTAGDAPKNFKFAVRDVAREAGVSPGVLGLIAANAMSDVPEDKDRWGSASNLAKKEEPTPGAAIVQGALRQRIELSQLDERDAALLRAASLST